MWFALKMVFDALLFDIHLFCVFLCLGVFVAIKCFNMKRTYLFISLILLFGCSKIDRKALVTRHNIEIANPDLLNSLTVGNGEFAFTADITGMQTFPEFYEKGISLGTQSQWGWHSFPNPENYTPSDVVMNYKVGNDSIPYLYQFSKEDGERKYNASMWLRENPHRLHLGLIGLEVVMTDSTLITIDDIKNPRQQLNLWTGELKSIFEVEGIPVEVTTFCHQQKDMVAFNIKSELMKQGRLRVKIRFPYIARGQFNPGYDFSFPEKHQSSIVNETLRGVLFSHQLDSTVYFSQVEWLGNVLFKEEDKHTFTFSPSEKEDFEISFLFSEDTIKEPLPTFSETAYNNCQRWKQFWMSGAAVDFSNCTDSRAFELERRVVLSQYLTKIQCSGSLPPQETGLTKNSWYGKFHLEMHWWHAAHFIQWNRAELMEKQLQFYFDAFEKARRTAALQGYDGARWQKMTDPAGDESPSTVGTFLIWQQPHLIYLADMLYRNHHNDKSVLQKYHDLVESTADFMASYARYDSATTRYMLGPALIPAQECFDPATTINPSFELVYWKWALQTAQNHRKMLGLPANEKWQQVIDHLSILPVKDGLYLFSENATDSYTSPRYLTDHPIVLGIEGFLPKTDMIDQQLLENSFNAVNEKWNWDTCWGWDFPLAAMCATMLDKPEQAINLLMMDTPKNQYLPNGHNYQDVNLPLYLPGNGSLLTAVAFMCTYKNVDGKNGFPSNGKWNVKHEDFFQLHVCF